MSQRYQWTSEKDRFLRANYHSMTAVALADALKCDRQVLLRRARVLNIRTKREAGTSIRRPYSESEKQFIRDHVAQDGVASVARELGRTEEAIRVFAKKNKISVGDQSWSEAHTQYLLENYDLKTAREIAVVVGRQAEAVRRKARDMGLRKRPGWTDEEDAYLVENYRSMMYADIAHELGKTENSVRKRAFNMGLKK